MKRPHILIVGSLAMDRTVTVSAFPSEGETVLGSSFVTAPGGKGANQAVQAARFGAEAYMLGKLGIDVPAREIMDVCNLSGVHIDHMLYKEGGSSGSSIIILEKKEDGSAKNRIIVQPGTNMMISLDEIAFVENIIKKFDMVMLQLEIPMEINERIALFAHKAGVPVMLNPAPAASLSDRFLSHCTYISPNEHEARALTGITIEHNGTSFNEEHARKACDALHARGVPNVLITLGDAGAVLSTPTDFMHSGAFCDVRAVDPTAAGDSFVAAFCSSVCSGMTNEQALLFANGAAAIAVSALGAMPSLPKARQVEDFLFCHGISVPDISVLYG